ncbi:hypothetical protein B9479_001912 [Cryptococcus floricola]|uniref:Uncharacterized protein n=1 Tax=Cryptococcus floricola TaxID=2591691 RepID=A0A5D3B5D8_9TREE|nr:hypothetical protein B9479_001912 [Cryptococcus floricola]
MVAQNKEIRVTWGADARLTSHLVSLISETPRYRECIFANAGDRWLVERDLCLIVLGDEAWMRDKESKGWVRRGEKGWEATEMWTSGLVHPVRNRLHLLMKRMRDGWYQQKYGVDPSWSSPDQIPEQIRASFLIAHPYYFTLLELWNKRSLDGEPIDAAIRAAEGKGKKRGPKPKLGAGKKEPSHSSPLELSAKRAGIGESSHDSAPSLSPQSLGPLAGDNHISSQLSPDSTSEGEEEQDELSGESGLAQPLPKAEPETDSSALTAGKLPGAGTLDLGLCSPPVKRSRGRPKGSVNKKPRKEGSAVAGPAGVVDETGAKAEVPVKRGRGRPKGSTNKKKV